ncbi:MAG TPA: hypothetical protein VK183_05705 [Flavobacterium sp.]|nr:hypothetical protein [Flavobacterium sp.]
MKKLPKIVEDLLTAQNNFDSTAYSDCFDETAVVFDEARIHHGKTQIKNWI